MTDSAANEVIELLTKDLVYEYFSHHIAAYEAERRRISRDDEAIVIFQEVFCAGGS
ncbi:MAG: hypothetical protein ACYTFT_01965 [Planctomycetota bacterium]|jgi:hypothetical protein